MTKTLVMIRHAHRDTTHREQDNGLSEKGREQARSLKRFFEARFERAPDSLWLVASPKLRCVETLTPIAKVLGRSVDLHPDLIEQAEKENWEALNHRVHRFLHEWSQAKVGLTVLCSHGDWLPLAVHHLLGVRQEFKKGAWLELDWEHGRAQLRWYVPTFKSLYR